MRDKELVPKWADRTGKWLTLIDMNVPRFRGSEDADAGDADDVEDDE